VRISPKKLARVVDLVRGLSVEEAFAQLQVAGPQRGAFVTAHVLKSAQANAVHNLGLDASRLRIQSVVVTKGTYLKRIKYHARGRSGVMHHPKARLRVVLEEVALNSPLSRKVAVHDTGGGNASVGAAPRQEGQAGGPHPAPGGQGAGGGPAPAAKEEGEGEGGGWGGQRGSQVDDNCRLMWMCCDGGHSAARAMAATTQTLDAQLWSSMDGVATSPRHFSRPPDASFARDPPPGAVLYGGALPIGASARNAPSCQLYSVEQ
jgi:ribosomal protein L22